LKGIDVFDYVSANAFVAAWYKQALRANARFSYRILARAMGVSSPAYLWHVIHGRRPVSQDLCRKMIKYNKMKKSETKYFTLLSYLSQLDLPKSLAVEIANKFRPSKNRS
jgi:uncharacterized protein (TIGR02147 family)